MHLSAALDNGARPTGADDGAVDRLLLAFEELASNALRHRRPPVRVAVTTTGGWWLLKVSDTAVDLRPSRPSAATRPWAAWACTWSPASAPHTAGTPTAYARW